MKEAKPLLGFSTAFVFCVFAFLGQSTSPLLADGALVLQSVSYSAGGYDIFIHKLDGGN